MNIATAPQREVTEAEAREFWEELKEMAGCHKGHDWEQRFHFPDGSETNYQEVGCIFYTWYCRKCTLRVGSCSKPEDQMPFNKIALWWNEKEGYWQWTNGTIVR